jgi:hypothetical protein
MPRCNLTLKQKTQLIELSEHLTTGQLAKKFKVHATTVTRTIKKKERILNQASRVNPNFKTVQTNLRSEEHDTMVLDYIKSKQGANVPISVTDICDKAIEFANLLGREIKSRRAWWRRFRIRCNVVRIRLNSQSNQKSPDDGIKQVTNETPQRSKKGSSKKVITLPTINLPKATSTPNEKTTSDNEIQAITNDGATGESSTEKSKVTNSDNGEGRTVEDDSAKESRSLNEECEPSITREHNDVLPKRGRPRKDQRKAGSKVTKRGRKKKGDRTSVINFTFKVRKSPSKSVPTK